MVEFVFCSVSLKQKKISFLKGECPTIRKLRNLKEISEMFGTDVEVLSRLLKKQILTVV